MRTGTKEFWRLCMTFRIIAVLDFVHRTGLKN
jgi:hypothetical protein